MMSDDPLLIEMEALLGELCESALTPDAKERLQDLVESHPPARRLYVDYLHLQASLQWDFTYSDSDTLSRNASSVEQAAPQKPDASASPTILSQFGSWMSAANRPQVFSVATAAAILFAGLTLLAIIPWRESETAAPTTALAPDAPSVARIVVAQDCVWTQRPQRGANLKPGDTLILQAGLIEIRFQRGAHVLVEGPAQFHIEQENAAALAYGKLTARVEHPRAVGFTINTPTASIVDLGTQFSVAVDFQAEVEVQVTQGAVEVHPQAGPSGDAPPPRIVRAGDAIRITPSARGIPHIARQPFDTSKFASRTRPAGPVPLKVASVRASSVSSVDPSRTGEALVNGRGLTGDKHTNLPSDTMWVSAFGKIEGEYVLFDLGAARRLRSMKIWNDNEAARKLFQVRGVSRADIYVSATGLGDPLTNPAEWTLVAGEVQLHAADGTPDYATPDVIDLKGVETRFVALVVLAGLGPLPRSRDVGLSEVQFWGEPVSAKSQPLR